MQPIPGWRAQQIACSTLVAERFSPAVDRVFMQAEAFGGVGGAPLPKHRQLHDLSPLLTAEVGALSRQLAHPLGSEDLQLSIEQRGL
tara:strand:+ start:818 stop:1078 length:261 start_codon:yes stop_codon:yes gene_type:complete